MQVQAAGELEKVFGFNKANVYNWIKKKRLRYRKLITIGYWGYVNIVYPGKHIRNIHDKSDTFTVEGINADIRHYIPILRRRSRCFPRTIKTLRAVLDLFVQAYNALGIAKMKFRKNRNPKSRELPFFVLDFL